MERRLTARGSERREQLLAYATERFAERGYHPTSVAEIVTGLGVGKGVFYWYFSSKEELFREILREGQRALRLAQRDAIRAAGIDSPIGQLQVGVLESLRWYAAHQDLFNLVRFAATEERFAPAIRKGEEVAAGDLARLLDAAVAADEVPAGDTTVRAHAILGVTSHLAGRFIHDEGVDPDEVADAALAFCLHGVLGAVPNPQGTETAKKTRSSLVR